MHNRLMKNKLVTVVMTCILLIGLAFAFPVPSVAGAPTDEILDYSIVVDVKEDGTLDMTYSIAWKVLESDSLGPLEWVSIGIPNKHCESYEALTDNIDYLKLDKSKGSYVNVYLKDKYYKDDVADFSFKITMDYMYLMDVETGFTEYTFTPGWFDEIDTDHLEIRWNGEKADRFSPECETVDGYYVWETSLKAGEKFTVHVIYPNDAYGFRELEQSETEDEEEMGLAAALAILFSFFIAIAIPVYVIVRVVKAAIREFTEFSGLTSNTKITRTKIEYYESCPGCGASRQEGKETCAYCGKNMVKSKEVIQEEKLPESERAALRKMNKDGTYRLSSSPNTYVHVHVTHPRPSRPAGSGRSRSGSRGGSCAHSSCACAGGGRAGCSTKDFYRTDFKLRYLYKRTKKSMDRVK